LDGGGVRALLQAILLARIVEIFPDFLDQFDCFAGTSAGSLIAVSLAAGIHPTKIVEFWVSDASVIFNESFFHKIITLDHLVGSIYSPLKIQQAFQKQVGNILFKNLKRACIVTSFQLDGKNSNQEGNINFSNTPLQPETARWKPVVFTNIGVQGSKINLTALEVCLRSSSAPVYFPIAQGYVDGGIYANNPAMVALGQCTEHLDIEMSDFLVFSIGTGIYPRYVPQKQIANPQWGYLNWAPYILDVILDGSCESVTQQAKAFLGNRFHRVNPILPTNIPLDDAENIKTLIAIAKSYDLNPTFVWISKNFTF